MCQCRGSVVWLLVALIGSWFAPAKSLAVPPAGDVFVLPSRHDGWGVVVNQALGAGLPLLCSDAVGAAHDLIESEVNGLIFPAGNAAALLACLRRLATSPETVFRWGQASRRKAAEWTPAAGAEKWLRVFESLSP